MSLPQIQYHLTRFNTSASKLSQCPEDTGAEVAFAGRSNAGKSSAINTLTNAKLARTSKTPGRTQLINFFDTNVEGIRIVDLPGYGYAKVPIAMKEHWQKHLDDYLQNRECLRGVVLMVDIRHPLKEFDQMMIQWCNEAGMPLHILLTKADNTAATCVAWPRAAPRCRSATSVSNPRSPGGSPRVRSRPPVSP